LKEQQLIAYTRNEYKWSELIKQKKGEGYYWITCHVWLPF